MLYKATDIPDNKIHGANMGPIWGRQDPGGPHVDPMNFAIWDHYAYDIVIQECMLMCYSHSFILYVCDDVYVFCHNKSDTTSLSTNVPCYCEWWIKVVLIYIMYHRNNITSDEKLNHS